MTKTLKIPAELYREARVSLVGEGEEQAFSMSISSDEPYKRYDWFSGEEYYEVIDHSPGGIDETRLKAGLPILFNHDRDQHLATAKSYSVTNGKCEVRDFVWSASEFAQIKKKDAASGALPTTSVGYRIIDDGKLIGLRDGIPVIKFKVEIFEGSLVTIPADVTVGVGRSKESGEQIREITITAMQNQPETPVTPEPEVPAAPALDIELAKKEAADAALVDFKARCKKIDAWVEAQAKPEWKESARKVAAKHKDGEANFNDFREEALNGFEKAKPLDTPEQAANEKVISRSAFEKMEPHDRAQFIRGGGTLTD